MMATNKINNSQKLRRIGWILLLQIHDEILHTGPEETAEEASEEVISCMEAPWVPGLENLDVSVLANFMVQIRTESLVWTISDLGTCTPRPSMVALRTSDRQQSWGHQRRNCPN
jgi:hypothetical protein